MDRPLLLRPGAVWLDSGTVAPGGVTGSALAAEPALWLRGRAGRLEILPGPIGDRGWLARATAADPGPGASSAWDRLTHIGRALWPPRDGPHRLPGDGPVFRGGLAGFFAYELGRSFESVPSRLKPRPSDVPWDFVLGLYDEVLFVDGATGERRVSRLPGSARRLDRRTPILPRDPAAVRGCVGAPVPEISEAEHAEAVGRVREHIAGGSIYQANLTLRFRAPSTHPEAPLATFLRLQQSNPAPCAAYLDLPGVVLVSASPECFLQLTPDGRGLSRPIKGTAPRGDTRAEDAALRAALLASAKDRAELTMIVDLVRNDLGRACVLGTVSRQPELVAEAHPSVWHLVADVTGQLRPDLDAFDLLRACFPPGSCIGAPKIRAMAVIEELERSRRGPYTGAIGWIGADGGLSASVAIRTIVFREGEASYGVGGGIVHDSVAALEWTEALLKGRALSAALQATSVPLTSARLAGN